MRSERWGRPWLLKLIVYQTGSWSWCRFRVSGKEYSFSTGTTPRREAEAFERRKRSEIETSAPTAKQNYTVADLVALDAERAVAEKVTPNVVKTMYQPHWNHLTRFFANPLPSLRSQDLLKYVIHRQKEGVRAKTIKEELTTFKRCLKLGLRAGWNVAIPEEWPKLKMDAKDERLRGKLRSPELLHQWLELLPPEARDQALFAAHTGLRSTEIQRLRPEWIQAAPEGAPVAGILRLPAAATKGRYERAVGLTSDAMAAIERVKARGLQDDGTLFGTVTHRKAYRSASFRLKVYPTITLRDLRHTFATNALAAGADLKALMSTMGHRTMAAADLYQSTTEARSIAIAAVATQTLQPKR